VRESSHIARDLFGGTFKRWSKAQGSPVTEADLAIDKCLREQLCSARPSYGWLSEESEDDKKRLAHETVFIVDPIDGTVAFLKARPHFTICAAVVHEGRPIAGAVYNPILDEMYAARVCGGATLNGAIIHVSERTHLEGARVLGSRELFEHPAWKTPPNRPWPSMDIENRSSIAYRLALVASSAFDAMMALSAKRDWDLAAADIIVTEAGGLASTHDGKLMRYNGPSAMQPSVIAAGPALHAEILARVEHIELPRK